MRRLACETVTYSRIWQNQSVRWGWGGRQAIQSFLCNPKYLDLTLMALEETLKDHKGMTSQALALESWLWKWYENGLKTVKPLKSSYRFSAEIHMRSDEPERRRKDLVEKGVAVRDSKGANVQTQSVGGWECRRCGGWFSGFHVGSLEVPVTESQERQIWESRVQAALSCSGCQRHN